MPLIAIPKTMDNDVQGTEYCIGFSTAITRAKELINRQRTTLGLARAHRRVPHLRSRLRLHRAVHRLRDDRPLPHPRGRPSTSTTWSRCWPRTTALNPSHYAFVIAAEGAMWSGGTLEEVGEADAFGHRHKANIAETLAAEIKRRVGHRDACSRS